MQRLIISACCALALLTPLAAQAEGDGVTGTVRAYRITREAASTGPLAAANALQPGTAAIDASTNILQMELVGDTTVAGLTLHAGALLHTQQADADAAENRNRINEAYASWSGAGWQWSAGKKVVSWDVGYGFRPNDVVQQETRRTLAAEALEGHPLLMAEHFNADSAWSLVWVNPTQDFATGGASESTLAARWYTRQGAADWHIFARQGAQTGASLGAAVSWVASDALELHASARGGQQLVGGTWTHESQVSLLLEAWHDDTAPSNAQWDAWQARNQFLPLLLARGVPVPAVAGSLATQANLFRSSSSLRQDNLFARLSWQQDRWQTALDLLYTPADQGLLATVSVVWTGERLRWEAGLRDTHGPDTATLRQVPVQRQGYAVATWAF